MIWPGCRAPHPAPASLSAIRRITPTAARWSWRVGTGGTGASWGLPPTLMPCRARRGARASGSAVTPQAPVPSSDGMAETGRRKRHHRRRTGISRACPASQRRCASPSARVLALRSRSDTGSGGVSDPGLCSTSLPGQPARSQGRDRDTHDAWTSKCRLTSHLDSKCDDLGRSGLR